MLTPRLPSVHTDPRSLHTRPARPSAWLPRPPADEVHLLSETRGASLEGVVARVKVVSR